MYSLSFQLVQNINSDMGVVVETPVLDEEGNPTGEVTVTNNFKVIIILYKNGNAYRYKVAEMTSYDLEVFTFQFNATFESSDLINEYNNIRINNLNIIGQPEDEFDYATSDLEESSILDDSEFADEDFEIGDGDEL